MNGSPATVTRDFGNAAVSCPNRVPRPPASSASGGELSLSENALICDQLPQRAVNGFAAIEFGLPAESTDSRGIQANHGNVSLPAAISAGVFEPRTGIE